MGILITRKETAKLLGIDPRTFDAHFRNELSEIRLGNKVLFRKKDVENLIKFLFEEKNVKLQNVLKKIGV